ESHKRDVQMHKENWESSRRAEQTTTGYQLENAKQRAEDARRDATQAQRDLDAAKDPTAVIAPTGSSSRITDSRKLKNANSPSCFSFQSMPRCPSSQLAMIDVNEPGRLFQSLDGLVTLDSRAADGFVRLTRKHPTQPTVIGPLRCRAELGEMILVICGEYLSQGGPGGGLGVSYADAIALIRELCDKRCVEAELWAGPLPE
ncbi:MAG: hypothetical protein IIC50_11225, partial [Planctomycetes bacterium]|nr:hypothetical protein [Planctomycetota bacterium]